MANEEKDNQKNEPTRKSTESSDPSKSNASSNQKNKSAEESNKDKGNSVAEGAKSGGVKGAATNLAKNQVSKNESVQKGINAAEKIAYAGKAIAAGAKAAWGTLMGLIATAKIWIPLLAAVLLVGIVFVGVIAVYQTIGRNDPTDLCEDIDEAIGGSTGSGDFGDSLVIPGEYKSALDDAAESSGIPVEILAAQIQQESNWDKDAASWINPPAMGLSQFMPGTWDDWGDGTPADIAGQGSNEGVWNPYASIEAQGNLMGHLYEQMEPHADNEEERIALALAGYNAGEGNVQRNNNDLESIYEDNTLVDAGGNRYEVPPTHPNYVNTLAGQTGPYIDTIMETAGLDLTVTSSGTANCFSGNTPSYSELADAAIGASWPWDQREESYANCAYPQAECGVNNMTPEMEDLWDAAYEVSVDPLYNLIASCDRFVAAVVIATGTDEDYPWGSSGEQNEYMKSSDKWEQIESNLSISEISDNDNWEPGDILQVEPTGHAAMYVGEVDGQPMVAHASIISSAAGGNGRTSHLEPVSTFAGWEGRPYNVFRFAGSGNSLD